MREHPHLTLQVPETTSMAKTKQFNKKRVSEFFARTKKYWIHKKFPYIKCRTDETELSSVHKLLKAYNSKHQMSAIPSGERGLTITCICEMNEACELIFKHSTVNDT